MTEVRDELVKKRYASERRFRFYGAAALALTALFLAILLIDTATPDIAAHEKSVEANLRLLEAQSLLQRNGDVYEFLTCEFWNPGDCWAGSNACYFPFAGFSEGSS